MQHEERPTDFPETVEVNTVPPLDELVVNQVGGSTLDMPDEGLQFNLPDMACLLDFMDVHISCLKGPVHVQLVRRCCQDAPDVSILIKRGLPMS